MNNEGLKEIVGHFDRICVLVAGDLMLDKFIMGTVSRISPEAPVPIVEVTSESFKPGGAANAIKNITVLGGNVIAVGVVGDDWYGRRLVELLKNDGVNTEYVIVSKERPTTVKTRVIVGQHQIFRMDREKINAINHECTKTILEFLNKTIEDVDAVLISDYDKGVVTNRLLEGLIPLAKKFGKPIIVSPKLDHFLDYKGVTIVITNIQKAGVVTGISQINETSIRNMGQWLLTHLECEYVLITRGTDGMSLFEKSGSVKHIPAIVKEVRNFTGVVDMVASLIALSLASDHTKIVDSVMLANFAAGIITEKPEPVVLTKEELKYQIDNVRF